MFNSVLECPSCGKRFHYEREGMALPGSIPCPECGNESAAEQYSALVFCSKCRTKLKMPADMLPDPETRCPKCGEVLSHGEFEDFSGESTIQIGSANSRSRLRLLKDGDFFDKYRIERLLGRGGMAEVYLAEHLLLQSKCALKLIKRGMEDDEVFIKRFVREAKLANRINHPNIVRVYDAGVDFKTGLLFLAMEYIEGKTVLDLAREKALSEQELIDLLRAMADALKRLDELHVVHRDIKPSNIMRTAGGVYKLMDLGIAKSESNRETGEMTLTVEQAAIGTPAYASPEQCRAAHEVDIRSDIYCLGATLYHAASGKIPFDGETPVAVILQVMQNRPEPLRKLRPDLSPRLVDLIERMMMKDPKDRPSSPDELLALIDAPRQSIRGLFRRKGSYFAAVAAAAVCCAAAGTIWLLPRGTAGKAGAKQGPAPAPPIPAVQKSSPVSGRSPETDPELKTVSAPPPARPAEPARTQVPPSADQAPKTGSVSVPKPVRTQVPPSADQAPKTGSVSVPKPVRTQVPPSADQAPKTAPAPASKQVPDTAADPVSAQEKKPMAKFLQPVFREVKQSLSVPETFEQRITHVEARIKALDQPPAGGESAAAAKFRAYRLGLRTGQLKRLGEQRKVRDRARVVARRLFNAKQTREVQKKFAAYIKKHPYIVQGDKAFTDSLVAALKADGVDPNLTVTDPVNGRYSGPLIKSVFSGRIKSPERVVEVLLERGADTSMFSKDKSLLRWGGFSDPVPSLTLILTKGGFDSMSGILLGECRRTPFPEDLIKGLLLLDHNVLERDNYGNTALYYAAEAGSAEIVKMLLALDADIDNVNNVGETPLFAAFRNGHGEIVRLLQELGADRTIRNQNGNLAADFKSAGDLKDAVERGDIAAAEKLLKSGVDSNTIFYGGRTRLTSMAFSGNRTALQIACMRRNVPMVKTLLAAGADPNLTMRRMTTYTRPLFLAFQLRSPEIAAVLLDAGADPNPVLEYLCRSRYFASGSPDELRSQILRLLLKSPKVRLTAARSGHSILTAALQNRFPSEYVSDLLNRTEGFSSADPVVYYAIFSGCPHHLIRTMIAKGANVNAVGKGNETPLRFAVRNKDFFMTKFLLSQGADPSGRSSGGKGAFGVPTTPQIQKLLIDSSQWKLTAADTINPPPAEKKLSHRPHSHGEAVNSLPEKFFVGSSDSGLFDRLKGKGHSKTIRIGNRTFLIPNRAVIAVRHPIKPPFSINCLIRPIRGSIRIMVCNGEIVIEPNMKKNSISCRFPRLKQKNRVSTSKIKTGEKYKLSVVVKDEWIMVRIYQNDDSQSSPPQSFAAEGPFARAEGLVGFYSLAGGSFEVENFEIVQQEK